MYKQLQDDIKAIQQVLRPELRYIDWRVRFAVVAQAADGTLARTGELSPVYGGIWDALAGQYDEERTAAADPGTVHTIDCSPTQLEVVVSDKMRQAVSGGRGGGKSVGCILRLIRRAAEWPGRTSRILCLKQVFCTSMWNKFKRRVPPGWILRYEPKDMVARLSNGSVLSFVSTRIPDSLRSVGYATLFVDELQSTKPEALSIAWPGLRKLQGASRNVIYSFTPAPEALGHWDRLLADKKSDTWELRDVDNVFVGTDEERRELREDSLLDEDVMAIEYGDWDAVRRLVEMGRLRALQRFNPEKHIIAAVPKGWRDITAGIVYKRIGRRLPFIIGLDFGTAVPSNAVALKAFLRPGDKQRVWVAMDHIEIQGRGLDIPYGLGKRNYLAGRCYVVPDQTEISRVPEEGGISSIRALRDAGYSVARSGTNPDVIDRLNAVDELLAPSAGGKPRLFFLRARTDTLCWSFMNAIISTTNPKRMSKTPLNESIFGRDPTDAVDACTYPLALFEPLASGQMARVIPMVSRPI